MRGSELLEEVRCARFLGLLVGCAEADTFQLLGENPWSPRILRRLFGEESFHILAMPGVAMAGRNVGKVRCEVRGQLGG